MRRPEPKLRPNLWDLGLFLAVAAAGVALAVLLFRGGGTEHLTAVVSVDGAEADRVALAGAEEERTYAGNGYTLRVSFSPEGVQVISADCPSQDCVHTGRVSRSGQSVVCLPARIVIRLEGGEEDPDAPDILIG